MIEEESLIGVALVKEACRICGKLYDGPILLNTRLNKKAAKKVEDLHGKAIGFMEKPCDECKELMKMGIVIVIFDREKTGDDLSNPYRTGHIAVLTEDYINRLIKNDEHRVQTLKSRVMFMFSDVAEKLGIMEILTNDWKNESNIPPPMDDDFDEKRDCWNNFQTD